MSSAGWQASDFHYGADSVAGRVLRSFGLLNNRHIPQALICDSVDVRQRLLAGIIDGDGYYDARNQVYELSAQHLTLITGYKELAATLGLRNSAIAVKTCTNQHTDEVYPGHRVSISGDMWDVVQYCATTYQQCPPLDSADYVEKAAIPTAATASPSPPFQQATTSASPCTAASTVASSSTTTQSLTTSALSRHLHSPAAARTLRLTGAMLSVCGKSTLMEILCKLHPTDPSTSPIISLNSALSSSLSSSPPPAGSSFLSLPRVLFRSVLSYIPQRPFIFPGSIEDNVRMGDTNATAAEVEAAAEAAGLFLYDQEEGRRAEPPLQPAMAAVGWKGEVRKKPWEVDRVGELLRKAWGWAKTAWDWHWAEVEDEGDEEDEEVWGGGFHMTEETALGPATQRRSFLASLPSISPSKRPPSLSPPAFLQGPLSPSSPASPDASPLPHRSSASSFPTAAASSHPVLSLECQEGGSNLSGGFAQSVALSRVFLRPSSQVVILDEAMGAMDPIKKVEWIVPHLMEWVRQHGQCLLVVTHDVRLICPLVDCVYVMEHGRVVLSGSHADLMERRAQPYSRMFGEA